MMQSALVHATTMPVSSFSFSHENVEHSVFVGRPCPHRAYMRLFHIYAAAFLYGIIYIFIWCGYLAEGFLAAGSVQMTINFDISKVMSKRCWPSFSYLHVKRQRRILIGTVFI